MRLAFTPKARADLLEIARYIASDDPGRAQSFAAELERRCAELLINPLSGRDRSKLAPELRSKPHGNYVIFYTPGDEVIRIERILHSARDVEAAFERRGS